MADPYEARRRALHPYAGRFPVNERMPERGVPREDVAAMLAALGTEEDARYKGGQVSGTIYSGDEEHYAFLAEQFHHWSHANVMQRDMYPSATKFEAEIVAMTSDMLHGDDDTGGVVTSGGTESLMNPMLVYREWGRETKGITEPQVIMPVTAHPALDKGCHYFGIELLKAPVDDDYVVDVGWVADHITDRTVALVGSAGTYPHGLIDDIGVLGALASRHGVGLHVDGCLGGFILPWGNELGYDVPPFDLRIPGVTSISADTHKYGYALKGTSVLLYRPKDLRHHQYFMATDWPGGRYSSPGMSGSRSGGIIAATWASMVTLGRDGYRSIAADIFRTAAELVEAITSLPELRVLGRPWFNVAFTTVDGLDIYHVNDHLASKGWRMNGLQLPPALHFCVTRPNTQPGVVERFAADLRDAVAYAKDPPATPPRTGAVYGTGDDRPTTATVKAGMASYLDATYEVGPTS
jgi:sphinganine-1-phosphate aldolase